MANQFELKPVQNRGVQFLVRLLISSYFMALATGIVPYENGRAFMELAFPAPYASFAFTGFVFTTAYLILLGKQVRIAAMLLSIFVFWASYIANFSQGAALDLQGFWSDMALIGALMLAATQGDGHFLHRTGTRFGKSIRPRRVRSPRPERVVTAPSISDGNPTIVADSTVVPLLLVNNGPPAVEFRRHQTEPRSEPCLVAQLPDYKNGLT